VQVDAAAAAVRFVLHTPHPNTYNTAGQVHMLQSPLWYCLCALSVVLPLRSLQPSTHGNGTFNMKRLLQCAGTLMETASTQCFAGHQLTRQLVGMAGKALQWRICASGV